MLVALLYNYLTACTVSPAHEILAFASPLRQKPELCLVAPHTLARLPSRMGVGIPETFIDLLVNLRAQSRGRDGN
jgi:hypothetical protein